MFGNEGSSTTFTTASVLLAWGGGRSNVWSLRAMGYRQNSWRPETSHSYSNSTQTKPWAQFFVYLSILKYPVYHRAYILDLLHSVVHRMYKVIQFRSYFYNIWLKGITPDNVSWCFPSPDE